MTDWGATVLPWSVIMTAVSTTRRVRTILCSAVIAALGASAHAAGVGDLNPVAEPADSPLYLLQNTQPATNAAGGGGAVAQGQAMKVTVQELVGIVSASTDDGKTWHRVKVGEAFTTGAIFRTGLKSAVTCRVGSDQMFTLESLSTI